MKLLNSFRDIFIPTATAKVDQDNNLFDPSGHFVASYTRRRDAIRGAKRRGFEVSLIGIGQAK